MFETFMRTMLATQRRAQPQQQPIQSRQQQQQPQQQRRVALENITNNNTHPTATELQQTQTGKKRGRKPMARDENGKIIRTEPSESIPPKANKAKTR